MLKNLAEDSKYLRHPESFWIQSGITNSKSEIRNYCGSTSMKFKMIEMEWKLAERLNRTMDIESEWFETD